MRKVYLDNAATTPVRPEVAEEMTRVMLEEFGNPSSIHSFGREARAAVDKARAQVAALINCSPEEIVFTSGATEADNLAIKGAAQALKDKGNHIITSKIEHHAVLHTCEYLEKQGFKVTYLPVDSNGLVDPDDVRRAIDDGTVLVTIMLANNEVGTIEPIEEIARIAHEKGVLVHTDAVQAVGQMDVDVSKLGVDLLSLSGHKMYGPKGIGALFVRKGVRLAAQMHGGGHERRRRAGTENVPGIVGLGVAARLAAEELPRRQSHLRELRDMLIKGLMERIDNVKLNGHPTLRLPNNVNVSILYVEGESLLLNLDAKGIAASSGSACTSGSLEPSHVLMAMGIPHEIAHGSLRLTVGHQNTEDDIEYLLEVLPGIVRRLREMSSIYPGDCCGKKV
ncbi:MAG: cysteine desulfurase NifS [Bacillota bacterium]